MYSLNDPERQKLNSQITEWNANRLDLFQISEPNDYLEFYGVMRFFFQGDDLKYQTKCLRVSSTATTTDVIDALIIKFHPDLKMLNNDKYVLHESHNFKDRKMMNGEHPLIVQLYWALDDKDGKFILKNESKRSQSSDITNISILSNNGMTRSTSAITNGFTLQSVRGQSSNFFSKRFASTKKSNRQNRSFKQRIPDSEDEKRCADEKSGKPPESSFTRTISNPDDVMKRRRQNKLESRLEQFSGVKGLGETGGTLKIYGDTIDSDKPYKTLLLSVNDTAEKVLTETLDKYGLSSEDHRFYVLVQQNIPPRDDKNRENMEEIILHEQDCPLGILVNCPPKRGSATFAVRRATPRDNFPSVPRVPPFSFSRENNLTTPERSGHIRESNRKDSKLSDASAEDSVRVVTDCPRLRKVIVDDDGTLYDEENGIFSLSSLVNLQRNDATPMEGSKFIKIGSQSSTVGNYPNILLPSDIYQDIRPVHCHISTKLDLQNNSMKLQLTPTLDSTSRSPRPCVLFINQQRIDSSTRLVNGDVIQLGESVLFRFEEFDEEMDSIKISASDSVEQQPMEDPQDSSNISYYTADLPVSVKYKYRKSQEVVEKIFQFSRKYAEKGHSVLFASNAKFKINDMDESFRLIPAYMMYLVIRAGLANDQHLIQLIEMVADRIEKVIHEDRDSVEKEIFWLSNTSELLHLLQYDNDLKHYSAATQDVLASAIERAFSAVQNHFSQDLMILLPALLNENDWDIDENQENDNIPCPNRASDLSQQSDIGYPIQHLLQTLSLVYNLFNNCQVNVALTIQMFSQLFHLLNTWLLNSILGEQSNNQGNESYSLSVCQEWGERLIRRLNRIRSWSEINGLDMAANCHLQQMYEVAELMEADKRDLNVFGETCIEMVNLNGAQLHHLLMNCQDYDLPPAWIEVVVHTAIQLHDQAFSGTPSTLSSPLSRSKLPLYEDMDLRLPLLLPADGYCCDHGIVSCPTDLKLMLNSLSDILKYRLNPPVVDRMDTRWKSYLSTFESTPTNSRTNTAMDQRHSTPVKQEAPYLTRGRTKGNETSSISETLSSNKDRYQKKPSNASFQYSRPQTWQSLIIPDNQTSIGSEDLDVTRSDQKNRFSIKISKINNTLGLSIIAARAPVDNLQRIYVKDVVKDSAASKCGQLAVGDQLVSIDADLLEGLSQDEAVKMMKKTKSEVTLVIAKGAAQEHGVMKEILQARNNKINHSSQKVHRRVASTARPETKKPQSRTDVTSRNRPSKSHSNTARLQISLPSLPTGKAPPLPRRMTSRDKLDLPPRRKESNLDDVQPDYTSLPVNRHFKKPQPLPEMPIYAVPNKVQPSQKRPDIQHSQDIYGKLSKSSSQPFLNKVDASSTTDSSSSDYVSSTDEEESINAKPKPKMIKHQSTVSSPQKKALVKQVPIVKNQLKNLGNASSESELRFSSPKKQVVSRPSLTRNSDPTISISSKEEDESIPSIFDSFPAMTKKKIPQSSLDSDTISSNTGSVSSSDHSIKAQRRMIPEAKSKNDGKMSTKTNGAERKISTGGVNLGGFKTPVRLTNSKSTEQLSKLTDNEYRHPSRSSPQIIDEVITLKKKKIDNVPLKKTMEVLPQTSVTVLPPPAPTAQYPQYHPPNNLREDIQSTNDRQDGQKPNKDGDVKMRRKQMAELIRHQSEEKAKSYTSIDSSPPEMDPHVTTGVTEDGPRHNGSNPSNRPASTTPTIKVSRRPGDEDLKFLPPPPPVDLASVLKSNVIGSKETYKDLQNRHHSSDFDTSQDGAEELSFKEKMKLFAKKIGDENVVDRRKCSKKQIRIDPDDYM